MKKLANVGFEDVRMLDRRPFGLDAVARYPLFPAAFLDFVREAVPSDRHDSIVFSVVVAAHKPGPRHEVALMPLGYRAEGVNIRARKP
jgi:hypothetical protein